MPLLLYSKKNSSAWLLVVAAYLSLLFPSSLDSDIEPILQIIQILVITFLLLLFSIRNGLNKINLLIGSLILFFLIIFTVLSPFNYVAIGGLPTYILIIILLSTSKNSLSFGQNQLIHILIINIFIFILGFSTVHNNDTAVKFTESFYKIYDDNLFESMIIWHSKPITTFGTHSVAAVAYFCMLWLNFKASLMRHISNTLKLFFYGSVICYFILLYLLLSNSSILLLALAFSMVMIYILKRLTVIIKFLFGSLTISLILLVTNQVNDVATYSWSVIEKIFSYDAGGFIARYTENGRLQPTYDYIINNPFLPVGLTYSENLAFGDNFIAEYVVKISIIGYALILIMLYRWLSDWYRESAFAIFIFFLIVDLAYPILTTFRLVGCIPLYILLLQYTNSGREN